MRTVGRVLTHSMLNEFPVVLFFFVSNLIRIINHPPPPEKEMGYTCYIDIEASSLWVHIFKHSHTILGYLWSQFSFCNYSVRILLTLLIIGIQLRHVPHNFRIIGIEMFLACMGNYGARGEAG